MVSVGKKITPEQQVQLSDEELTVETIEPEQISFRPSGDTYDDCRAPWFSIALNLACSLLYGYSLYFLSYSRE